MSDEVQNEIDKLKKQVAEWPNDQKASFIGGISDGICLAILIAKEAGCNLAKNNSLMGLVDFLGDQKCPPVKIRTETAQKPKPARDQLVEDLKELLRRAIACRLRMPKETFDTSLDAEDMVNKYFLTVVAIGNRKALDDAIQDIRIMRSIAGGVVDRESVKSEVETCNEKFGIEIGAIERFNDLSTRNNLKPKEIWDCLRSNVTLDYGYEDDVLAKIDARYQ